VHAPLAVIREAVGAGGRRAGYVAGRAALDQVRLTPGGRDVERVHEAPVSPGERIAVVPPRAAAADRHGAVVGVETDAGRRDAAAAGTDVLLDDIGAPPNPPPLPPPPTRQRRHCLETSRFVYLCLVRALRDRRRVDDARLEHTQVVGSPGEGRRRLVELLVAQAFHVGIYPRRQTAWRRRRRGSWRGGWWGIGGGGGVPSATKTRVVVGHGGGERRRRGRGRGRRRRG
jgi:hypothetical protein